MSIDVVTVTLSYNVFTPEQNNVSPSLTDFRIVDITLTPSQFANPGSDLNLALEVGRGLAFIDQQEKEESFFSFIMCDIDTFLKNEFPQTGFKKGIIKNTKQIVGGKWLSGEATITFERNPLDCPALSVRY